MDLLGFNLNKLRPRRRSIGTIAISNLESIPDNDQPMTFTSEEDEARMKLVRKQSKRRGSCPVATKVCMFVFIRKR